MALQKPWDNYPIEYINITQEQLVNLLTVDETMDIYLNFPERWNSLDNLPGEVWTNIKEYDNLYSISCYGRLKRNSCSLTTKNFKNIIQRNEVSERIINGYILNRTNYPEHIFDDKKHYTIHQLVAKYFIKNDQPEFNIIDHKNTIKHCAHIFNLWWCNDSLNIQNPLTKRLISINISSTFERPDIDTNASENDNIEDYLYLDKIFSARMFTDVNFKDEVWKYVQIFNVYVSNYGRIKVVYDDGSIWIVKQTINKYYYLSANVNHNSIAVHYLVLYAFHKINHYMKYEDNMSIDHINTKPYDNRLCNLRYVTYRENMKNELTKEHITESYNKPSTPILLYDAINFEFICEYKSINKAAKELNTSTGIIKRTIDLKCVYKNKWIIFKKENNNIKNILDITDIPYYNHKVNKYNKDGKFICSYNNAYEIRNITSSEDIKYIRGIYSNCTSKKATFDNFQWRFAEETSSNTINKAESHMFDFAKINAYDYNGNFIKQFNSSKETAQYFKISSTSVNRNINLCDKNTVSGMYFRYTNNIKNNLNLWDSGLFNKSTNSTDIFKASLENVNIIKDTDKIINVYDISDGYIIKRYYSISLCAKELNVNRNSLRNNSIISKKYYIVITSDNDNFQVKINILNVAECRAINQYKTNGEFIKTYENIDEIVNDTFKDKNQIYRCCNRDKNNMTAYGYVWRWSHNDTSNIESIDFIKERNSRAYNNKIVIYNYYTLQKLGEFNIDDAEKVTRIKKVTIMNCCEKVFEYAVNMENLETYCFCYKFNENNFEINKDGKDSRIYILYNISDGKLYNLFYTQVELCEEIGYTPVLNRNETTIKIVRGKYILKSCYPDENIHNDLTQEELKEIIDNIFNFNNQYARKNEYKILKFTLDGEFVESFNSFIEISKNSTVRNKIRECANHIIKSAYGFQWRFSTECKETDNIGPRINQRRANYGRILKFSLDGNYIETFKDLYSIPVEKKRQREQIHICAIGNRHSALGFIWKYEKDLK